MTGDRVLSRRAVFGLVAAGAIGVTLDGCAGQGPVIGRSGYPSDDDPTVASAAGSLPSTAADPLSNKGSASADSGDPTSPVTARYGSDESQYADLYLPAGARKPGVVMIIHGGFWLSEYGADLGAPLATDLATKGWVVWNLEYRRVGNGGGWPTTLQDVAAGTDMLATVATSGEHGTIDTSRVVAVGHSAGGQLAAWLAGRPKLPAGAPGAIAAGKNSVAVTGVVSQAGVLDLTVAASTGIGGGAVPGLLGGTPKDVPQNYQIADPIKHLPLGVPVHCVHGHDDGNVPFAQSTAYVEAATTAGDIAVLHPIDGDHFTLIDPTSDAWTVVVDLLPELMARSPH